MQMECDYLLALRWQEKAERCKYSVQMQQGGGANGVRHRDPDAWISAQTFWSNYGHRNTWPRITSEQHRDGRAAGQNGGCCRWPPPRWTITRGCCREAPPCKAVKARALEQHGSAAGGHSSPLENLVKELTKLETDLGKRQRADRSAGHPRGRGPPGQRRGQPQDLRGGQRRPRPAKGSLFWLRYSALLRLEQPAAQAGLEGPVAVACRPASAQAPGLFQALELRGSASGSPARANGPSNTKLALGIEGIVPATSQAPYSRPKGTERPIRNRGKPAGSLRDATWTGRPVRP